MQLIQQKYKTRKEFTLLPAGMRIRTTHGKGMPTEEMVPFENLRSDRFAFRQVSYGYLVCGGVSFLIAALVFLDSLSDKHPPYVFLMAWWGISTLSFLLFFLHRPQRYFLKTYAGSYIRFYTGCDDEALEWFVQQVLKARNEYLRKYTMLTPHLSYEGQYSNLLILHREGVLSTGEYTQKSEELNRLFTQTTPKQLFSGFSRN